MLLPEDPQKTNLTAVLAILHLATRLHPVVSYSEKTIRRSWRGVERARTWGLQSGQYRGQELLWTIHAFWSKCDYPGSPLQSRIPLSWPWWNDAADGYLWWHTQWNEPDMIFVLPFFFSRVLCFFQAGHPRDIHIHTLITRAIQPFSSSRIPFVLL